MGETADWLEEQRQNNLSAMDEIIEALNDNIVLKYKVEIEDVDRVYDAIANAGESYINMKEALDNIGDRYDLANSKGADSKEKEDLKRCLFGI